MALRRVLSNSSSKITAAATAMSTTQKQLRRHSTICDNLKLTPELAASKDKYEYHGLIAKGANAPFLISPTLDGFVFRLDMPGITNSELRTKIDGPKISVSAQETKPHRFGSGQCEPRYYEAVFEMDPEVYSSQKVKAEVKNGVMWLKVPRVSAGPGWVFMHIGRVKTYYDRNGKVEVRGLDESDGTYKVQATSY